MHAVQDSRRAVEKGDYNKALQLYTEALALDPANHILYTNRSAAYAKTKQFERALKDARKARTLNPKWAKVSDGSLIFFLVFAFFPPFLQGEEFVKIDGCRDG